MLNKKFVVFNVCGIFIVCGELFLLWRRGRFGLALLGYFVVFFRIFFFGRGLERFLFFGYFYRIGRIGICF